jgi:hypothetical protein
VVDPVSYSSLVPLAFIFIVLVTTEMYINNQLKKEKPMETRKKVNQKPKSTLKVTIIVTSILETLWAIGTSVVASGVLLRQVPCKLSKNSGQHLISYPASSMAVVFGVCLSARAAYRLDRKSPAIRPCV